MGGKGLLRAPRTRSCFRRRALASRASSAVMQVTARPQVSPARRVGSRRLTDNSSPIPFGCCRLQELEELPREEVIARLRKLKHPVTLFGALASRPSSLRLLQRCGLWKSADVR